MTKIYHVSKKGSDQNSGSAESPFLTIQKAADTAIAGDTVIVGERACGDQRFGRDS